MLVQGLHVARVRLPAASPWGCQQAEVSPHLEAVLENWNTAVGQPACPALTKQALVNGRREVPTAVQGVSSLAPGPFRSLGGTK